jgi:hypothetical protein
LRRYSDFQFGATQEQAARIAVSRSAGIGVGSLARDLKALRRLLKKRISAAQWRGKKTNAG